MSSLGRLGGVYALLHASHHLGDYWVQQHEWADTKGNPGWDGRLACGLHVATLTATQALTLTAGARAAGERLPARRIVAGLAVNAISHYWADRRTPLRRLAHRVRKGDLYALGAPRDGYDDNRCLGSGAHALDQAWHLAWLAVAAAIIAGRD